MGMSFEGNSMCSVELMQCSFNQLTGCPLCPVLVPHTGARQILPRQRCGNGSLILRAGCISLLGILIYCSHLCMIKGLMDFSGNLSQCYVMLTICRFLYKVNKTLLKTYILVPEISLLLSEPLVLFDFTLSCFSHYSPVYGFM